MTNICSDKSFVPTKYVLRQNFCCKTTFVTTKDMFCCNKHMFVTTKMIFVAASANDRKVTRQKEQHDEQNKRRKGKRKSNESPETRQERDIRHSWPPFRGMLEEEVPVILLLLLLLYTYVTITHTFHCLLVIHVCFLLFLRGNSLFG